MIKKMFLRSCIQKDENGKKEIELIIKENPSMFSEIFYERRVNNIYLDSLGMRSFFEHISGFDERLKIRIRWYGKMFGFIEKPELEIKVKKNEFGNKIRFPLKPFSLDKNFSFSELKKVFFQSNLPRWIEEELRLSFPILLNSYKRKYFQSQDKKFRLTLDSELEFFKIKNLRNLFLEKTNVDENVLELKYDIKNFEEAERVCQGFPFRSNAYSKFISGVSLLEL